MRFSCGVDSPGFFRGEVEIPRFCLVRSNRGARPDSPVCGLSVDGCPFRMAETEIIAFEVARASRVRVWLIDCVFF